MKVVLVETSHKSARLVKGSSCGRPAGLAGCQRALPAGWSLWKKSIYCYSANSLANFRTLCSSPTICCISDGSCAVVATTHPFQM